MKRERLVIDASVFVAALLHDETHSAHAAAFMQSLGENPPEIHIPAIAIAEVASALTRRTGKSRIAAEAALKITMIPGITLHDFGEAAVAASIGLLDQAPLRALDLAYVVVSAQVGATLITLDVEMKKHAQPIVAVESPLEWTASSRHRDA